MEKFDQKIRVLCSAHSHSKLVYIGAQGAFRKFVGSVTKNGYLKIVGGGDLKLVGGSQNSGWKMGRPFGSTGGRILEGDRMGGGRRPPYAPSYNR